MIAVFDLIDVFLLRTTELTLESLVYEMKAALQSDTELAFVLFQTISQLHQIMDSHEWTPALLSCVDIKKLKKINV